MSSVQINTPYTVSWLMVDANGSPVVSDITASVSLYHATGPSSAAVHGPEALAYLGDGEWGYTIPASALDEPGLYYARVPSVSGALTLGELVATFTVGEVSHRHRTLREVLLAIYRALGDVVTGTTTNSGSTTTLRDTARVDTGLADNEWVGSQLVILEPAAGEVNPVTVTDFDETTGIFTFAPAITSVASGIDYWLVHHKGAGHDFNTVRQATLDTVSRLAPREWVEDWISLTAASDTYRYSVPRPWVDVRRVWYDRRDTRSDVADPRAYREWAEIAPALVPFDAASGQLSFRGHMPLAGRAIRIGGYVELPEPRALTSVVPLPYTLVVDTVVSELLVSDRDRAAIVAQRAEGQRRGMRR